MTLPDASTAAGEPGPMVAPIVVPGALAARQWETILAARDIDAGTPAWITPPLIGYASLARKPVAWAGPAQPMPLTPPQSLALWRRVIRSSEAGAELIGDGGAADWAAEAWQLAVPLADRSRARARERRAARLRGVLLLVPRISQRARGKRLDRPSGNRALDCPPPRSGARRRA